MAALLKKPKESERRKSSGDPEDYRLTLIEHLEELRDRLIKSISLLVVATVIGWFLEPFLYDYLQVMIDGAIRPHLPKGVEYKEVFHNMPDAFMLQLKLAFVIGLVLSFPFIVLQLWAFIGPGLKPSERKPFARLAPLSFFLFALGACFAWLMMPATLLFFTQFLFSFPGTSLYQEAGTIAFFVLKMMLAFGVAFQLPLVVFILGELGLLSAETLMKYWRHATVSIFVIAMVVTPSQDPLTMTIMAVPLVILFMISAWAVKVSQGRKKKRLTVIDGEANGDRDYLDDRIEEAGEPPVE
jgi:sec-independent protein translocase protein TatC